jgi:Protein of unknown function (DUF3099)
MGSGRRATGPGRQRLAIAGSGARRAQRGADVSEPERVEPVLITDAAMSPQEELAARKRRYTVMMAMRVPFMILAAVFYNTPWLAVTLLLLSVPLPWMAVLIANDRLPRKVEKVHRYRGERAELESRPHPVIDG